MQKWAANNRIIRSKVDMIALENSPATIRQIKMSISNRMRAANSFLRVEPRMPSISNAARLEVWLF